MNDVKIARITRVFGLACVALKVPTLLDFLKKTRAEDRAATTERSVA